MSITAFRESCESFQQIIETEGGFGNPLNLQLLLVVTVGFFLFFTDFIYLFDRER